MVTVSNQQTKRQPLTRLSAEQRDEVRRLLKAGVRKEVLAVQFNVHFNTIGNIEKEADESKGRPLDRDAQVRTTSTNGDSVAPNGGKA